MVRQFGVLVVGLALTGCNQATIGGEINGEVFTTPARVLDWGDRSIGSAHVARVEFVVRRAPIELTSLSVRTTTGNQPLFWALPSYPEDQLGEILGDDLSDTDSAGVPSYLQQRFEDGEGPYALDFVFRSDVSGYFQGVVELGHSGLAGDQTIDLLLRARATTPCATVFPPVVDFGTVPRGEERCVEVDYTACGALPLVVTDVRLQNNDFRVDSDVPITVPAGQTVPVSVCYDAPNDDPATGRMLSDAGEESLTEVQLRANDCLNGLPADYDQDNDGFTTCGGDCDDNDPLVNPAQVEGRAADGKDNDCNGLTDDRTTGYDNDGDGYCASTSACLQPGVLPGDCNDGDEFVNPGMEEDFGNGIDDDCDGTTDNGTEDLDGDGYTEAAGDCDDDPNGDGADRYPGNPEVPDGIDNDCDLRVDEGTVRADDDGDGYCEIGPCSDGSLPGDCDDRVNPINPAGPHPGADSYPDNPEAPDGEDNDCDGVVDNGTDRYDDDDDGYSEIGGDCDDDNPNIAPNVLEKPNNGIDDDCNPATPVGQPE